MTILSSHPVEWLWEMDGKCTSTMSRETISVVNLLE